MNPGIWVEDEVRLEPDATEPEPFDCPPGDLTPPTVEVEVDAVGGWRGLTLGDARLGAFSPLKATLRFSLPTRLLARMPATVVLNRFDSIGFPILNPVPAVPFPFSTSVASPAAMIAEYMRSFASKGFERSTAAGEATEGKNGPEVEELTEPEAPDTDDQGSSSTDQ